MMKTTISEIMGWSWSCSDDLTAANQDRQAWDGGNQPTQKLPWHGGKNENIRILNVPETPGSRSPTAVSKLLKETELGQRRSDRSVTQGSPHKEARWCHCGESTLLSRLCWSPSPCQGVQSSPVQRNRHLLIPRFYKIHTSQICIQWSQATALWTRWHSLWPFLSSTTPKQQF